MTVSYLVTDIEHTRIRTGIPVPEGPIPVPVEFGLLQPCDELVRYSGNAHAGPQFPDCITCPPRVPSLYYVLPSSPLSPHCITFSPPVPSRITCSPPVP